VRRAPEVSDFTRQPEMIMRIANAHAVHIIQIYGHAQAAPRGCQKKRKSATHFYSSTSRVAASSSTLRLPQLRCMQKASLDVI